MPDDVESIRAQTASKNFMKNLVDQLGRHYPPLAPTGRAQITVCTVKIAERRSLQDDELYLP